MADEKTDKEKDEEKEKAASSSTSEKKYDGGAIPKVSKSS